MEKETKIDNKTWGLPWIAIIIGCLCGYLSLGNIEGIFIGGIIGVIISLVTYVGIIPILGVYLYILISSAIFELVPEIDFTFLYVYGLIISILYTVIGIILLFAFIIMIRD